MSSIYLRLGELAQPLADWPDPRTDMEYLLFACAAMVFSEPARGESARLALLKALGVAISSMIGFLAFVRDRPLLDDAPSGNRDRRGYADPYGDHEELARLLMEDPEADRCEWALGCSMS